MLQTLEDELSKVKIINNKPKIIKKMVNKKLLSKINKDEKTKHQNICTRGKKKVNVNPSNFLKSFAI